MNRPGDILDLLLSHVVTGHVRQAVKLVGFGEGLQARRHIDARAEYGIALVQYTTSPRLMPIRSSKRLSRGSPSLRICIASWIARLLWTASVTLENSASQPSPAVSTMRPRKPRVCGSTTSSRIDLRR